MQWETYYWNYIDSYNVKLQVSVQDQIIEKTTAHYFNAMILKNLTIAQTSFGRKFKFCHYLRGFKGFQRNV